MKKNEAVEIQQDRRPNDPANHVDPVIDADNVSLFFNGVPAIEDVSLQVQPGEVVSIVGPSGAGKSTFLRCLNLLARPSAGRIAIEGKLVFDDSLKVNRRELRDLRRSLGMVFQHLNLFPHLTAIENVTLAILDAEMATREEAVQSAANLLERVGVLHRALSPAPTLSGGEKQRVAIARALAMQPRALLFDEPTSALDPESSREVLSVMRELVELGTTMVIVTHEMNFARQVSDKVLFMEAGKAVEEGPPEQLFNHATTARAQRFFSSEFGS